MNEETIKAFKASRKARKMYPSEPLTALDLAVEARDLHYAGQVTGKANMMGHLLNELVRIMQREHDYYTDPDYAVRQDRREIM